MCDKKSFFTQKQASKAAKGYAAMKGKRKQLAYFCADCKAWHLTTRESRKEKRKRV